MSAIVDIIQAIKGQPLSEEQRELLLTNIMYALNWDILDTDPKNNDGTINWEQSEIEELREIKRMLGHGI